MTFADKILEAAQEGIVLLKNEKETLPLKKEENIAVFGRGQIDFIKCGLGSGGSVHAPYSTNLIDNLPNADKILVEKYRTFVKENPFDNGGGAWAAEPWNQKEMDISKELALECATRCSKAVVVITRNAGEDKDLINEKGSWSLTDNEFENIKNVCNAFEKVCILFNTCGIVDNSWFDSAELKGHITAVVYAWQGGQECGRAAANVLLGKVNPSGKLSCTVAKTIEDYPSTADFNTGNDSIYLEDIYVGYRYFNTFAKEKILYPFGFGLSYTTFSVEFLKAKNVNNEIFCKALVKNTGNVAGKEVIQLYVSCAQGKLGKPEKELAAFIKTSLLQPGQEELVELSFNLKSHSSYDDSGVTGHAFCKVLEEGKYYISGGTDSINSSLIKFEENDFIELKETLVVEQLTSAVAPVVEFERYKNSDGKLIKEKTPIRKYDLRSRIENSIPEEVLYTGDKGIKFLDVKADPKKIDVFIAQLDDTMLMTLCRGEGMMSRKTIPGLASAMGGLSEALYKFGIPVAGCADGPSGIRMDTGTEANLMPIGTLLACSWNLQLVKELMEFEGDELLENKIDTCLGPGINIQRNPLNGRNFEYFSEDPLLTGAMTCSILDGIQTRGVWPTIKHFAANNRESGRRMNNAIVSERALREIYFVPFEMAVKKSKVQSIMSSYNLINGVQAASNYELCQTVLRDNWKYEGLVMTDWWATLNDCVEGGESDVVQVSQMIRSRNDVYMICQNDKAELDGNDDDLRQALKSGKIKRSELQRCARDIINFMIKTKVAERPLRGLNDVPGFISKLNEIPKDVIAYGEDIKFMKNGTTKAYIEILEDDVYNFFAMLKKDNDGTVSQSVCNLNIDSENALSLNCRTTEGKTEGAIIGLLKLTKGFYQVELVHSKPGIQIEYIGFSRKITVSSGMRRFREYGEVEKECVCAGQNKKKVVH